MLHSVIMPCRHPRPTAAPFLFQKVRNICAFVIIKYNNNKNTKFVLTSFAWCLFRILIDMTRWYKRHIIEVIIKRLTKCIPLYNINISWELSTYIKESPIFWICGIVYYKISLWQHPLKDFPLKWFSITTVGNIYIFI